MRSILKDYCFLFLGLGGFVLFIFFEREYGMNIEAQYACFCKRHDGSHDFSRFQYVSRI